MNASGIVLETRRLILRRLTLEDAGFILELPGDSADTSLYARKLDDRRRPS